MTATGSRPVVALREHVSRSGAVIGHAELDSPSTLNALSLEMVDALTPALTAWQQDERVACVLLTGAGDRAFCAGGDVQALYRAMLVNEAAGEPVDGYPDRFFEREYRLDYLLHTFAKPVIAVGHAIVMGGGLGLFSGSQFRVATERTRVALPEVTIGLFPDAGGTWLLRNLPRGLAAFIGMTGASVNATDALAGGVATHSVAFEAHGTVLDRLLAVDLDGTKADVMAIEEALARLPTPPLPPGESAPLGPDFDLSGSYADVAGRVDAFAGRSAWFDRGIATMQRGCPTSVGIVIEQLRRAPTLDLDDCFRLELDVATHCARFDEFREGVRALIIDKDNQPNWRYASVAELDPAHVAAHFASPWAQHPLRDLGAVGATS
jgi:enoyl-CoA hydratase/carnithine racemase